MAPRDVRVRGHVLFDPASPPFTGADLRIRLEDVSVADAPAPVLLERHLRDAAKPPGAAAIAFSLHGSVPLDPAGRYSLRVLVDVDRSGDISTGDFINTRSCPVDASAEGEQTLDIMVTRVE